MTPASRASHDLGRSGDDAIAARAADDARELAGAFEHAAARVRRQPAGRADGAWVADAEAVHDLRVATRRLIASLSLWRPVLKKPHRRAALHALRKIRRAFGPVRELEVHAGQARARIGTSIGAAPAVDKTLAGLVRALRRRHAHARTEALPTISARRVKDVLRDIARTFEVIGPRWASPRRRARVAERLSGAQVGALDAFRAARAPNLSADDEAFHRARIAIKKWRYVAEREGQAHGATKAPIERLRELQSALGHAHDAITFAEAIARFAARSKARHAALAAVLSELHAEANAHIERFLGSAALSSRKPSSRVAASSRGSSRGT